MSSQQAKNAASELAARALEIRQDIIKSLAEAGSGHTGGSLGLADLFACLYFRVLRHRPGDPLWAGRDRFILSIGHVAPVLYASLAHAGYFPREELMSLRKLGSRLQGHPGRDHKLPGIELSAGSLGQGLSVACGMALAAKLDEEPYRVYCLLGDGELQEGSVWEAAMSAGHHKLGMLTAIVDRNKLQIDGPTSEVMEIEPLKEKWKAFGWEVMECNGHDHQAIVERLLSKSTARPRVLIAHTVMGKGIPSIEGNHLWHGRPPTKAELPGFLEELQQSYQQNIQDHE